MVVFNSLFLTWTNNNSQSMSLISNKNNKKPQFLKKHRNKIATRKKIFQDGTSELESNIKLLSHLFEKIIVNYSVQLCLWLLFMAAKEDV